MKRCVGTEIIHLPTPP